MVQDSYNSLSQGREVIRRYYAQLPLSPGVYQMVAADGTTLYVGKAKQLKNRVGNYVNVGALNTRLQRMVSHTASMQIITTRSEAEALLLEANLVKKLAPRYNILLKDDKSFPYIFISDDHPFPRIEKHRGAKSRKGKYLGPFVSANAVNETLALLQKAFLLRPCSDNVFKNRTRPCLQYQIKRCSAPCVKKIDEAAYRELVIEAVDFLTGKSGVTKQRMIDEMQAFSLNMQFEEASALRDRIRALAFIQNQNGMAELGIENADVMALARAGGSACIQLFSIRHGRNYGGKSWFPAHTGESSDSEIVAAFLSQFYQNHPIPPTILTSHLLEEAILLEEALRLNTDYKIEILCPMRGPKRNAVEQAMRNAREELTRHMAINISNLEALAGVRDLFGMDDMPTRVEVYDNSHIQGSFAVGAMIVAGQEGFIKNSYRKYNMEPTDAAGGDDYAMMKKMLTRRFIRLQQEEDAEANRPDLVLIDGGAGQLSAVQAVFDELGVQGVTLVAISKGVDRNAGREWFHMTGKEPFQLPVNDSRLHYLQRLRDEAHRFAIGTHRAKRSKAISASPLDDVPFIGPTRKKALLMHFGSAKAVSAASQEQIEQVAGISKSMAKIIFDHFHT